jgi:hypothetical protein
LQIKLIPCCTKFLFDYISQTGNIGLGNGTKLRNIDLCKFLRSIDWKKRRIRIVNKILKEGGI